MLHLLRAIHDAPLWWLRPLAVWLVFGSLVTLGLRPGSADAAVAFRAATCAQNSSSTTLTLSVPSGTEVGDLLVASIGISNASINTPGGWTQVTGLRGTVHAEQELATFYRYATSPIPSDYTFTGTASPDGIAGGILAFSGVSTTAPIAGTPAQTIQSSLTTSDTLPNSSGVAPGSMRLSAVVSDDLTVSSYPGGPTKTCDEGNETGVDVATSIAREVTGSGTTATRTVTRSDNARSVLQTLVLNPGCANGVLDLTVPSSISFPTTTLNGLDQGQSTVAHLTVDDQTGSNAGWNLSATSTRFTNGTSSLPADAVTVTDATPTSMTGNCAMPTNAVNFPMTLPAAATAPTAQKVFNAAVGTGRGPIDLALGLALALPAHARVGSYTSTWTLTLAAGP